MRQAFAVNLIQWCTHWYTLPWRRHVQKRAFSLAPLKQREQQGNSPCSGPPLTAKTPPHPQLSQPPPATNYSAYQNILHGSCAWCGHQREGWGRSTSGRQCQCGSAPAGGELIGQLVDFTSICHLESGIPIMSALPGSDFAFMLRRILILLEFGHDGVTLNTELQNEANYTSRQKLAAQHGIYALVFALPFFMETWCASADREFSYSAVLT